MTSFALALAEPLEHQQRTNEPEIKSIFSYVGRDGEPVDMPTLPGTRILEIEEGNIDKVKDLVRQGKMSLGFHDNLIQSLEETNTPFYLIRTTSLSDAYLNDPKTPYPECGQRLRLAPR